jgi:hypothetical protein
MMLKLQRKLQLLKAAQFHQLKQLKLRPIAAAAES